MIIDSHCHLHDAAFADVRETVRLAVAHDVYGIVAVGCVNRATATGSLAAAPGVAPATPATAGALANSVQDPTNAFVLKGATPPDATDETRQRRLH